MIQSEHDQEDRLLAESLGNEAEAKLRAVAKKLNAATVSTTEGPIQLRLPKNLATRRLAK